jgi:hypothetical protein
VRPSDALGLLGGDARDGLDQCLDHEGLSQHRRRAELIGLCHRLCVRGANDDRRLRVALLDPKHERTRETALVSMKTREIGDDQIGSRVGWGAIQIIDEHERVALVAQHLAKKVGDGTVVLDDQDLIYLRQAGGFGPGRQF